MEKVHVTPEEKRGKKKKKKMGNYKDIFCSWLGKFYTESLFFPSKLNYKVMTTSINRLYSRNSSKYTFLL